MIRKEGQLRNLLESRKELKFIDRKKNYEIYKQGRSENN